MSEFLAALRWYLAVQAVGLAALPMCLRLFRHLPDRGLGVSKQLGLLLTGWIFWLFVTFGWLPNTGGGILVAIVLVASLGLLLTAQPPGIRSTSSSGQPGGYRSVLTLWRSVLATEAVFTLSFAAWCIVRAHMPRIQTAGGEKWMEIAFLRAILRSDRFPPLDPWLSGFAISYYYFGYLLVSMLTRLAGISPSVAFNLSCATLFALTSSGAYCLVLNLLALKEGGEHEGTRQAADPALPARNVAGQRWVMLGGLTGPLLVALMGNLEGLLEVLHARGIGPASFWKWFDIRSINVAPPPFAEGSWVPTRFFWWWQASRVVRDLPLVGDHQEVIDEFPAFSFILGDVHPHVLALPFVLLAIALALNLYLQMMRGVAEPGSPRPWPPWLSIGHLWPLGGWTFPVYALCLGALGFLNTWDFPIYLFVNVAAYGLGLSWGMPRVARHTALRAALLLFVSLLAAGILMYFPFWISFQSQAGGILVNLFNPTRLQQFLVMFGPLLVIGAIFVADQARQTRVERRVSVTKAATEWALTVVCITALILVALGIFVGAVLLSARLGLLPARGPMVYLSHWLRGEPIPGLEGVTDAHALILGRIRARVANQWTALALIGLLSSIALTLWHGTRQAARRSLRNKAQAGDPFILLLLATGVLLALSVEYVYLRDQFGTRMNTVFKFYFQAWVLWAVAGAYALVGFVRRNRVGAATAAVLLITAGLIYPVLAIPARAREYGGPTTLDGMAHLASTHPDDYLAITWLNQHVPDAPVILEAPADHYRAYVYEGRVSAHTGLPTVLGWAGHEYQWRGNYVEQARREADIEIIYSSETFSEALPLLDKHGISYVYVGPTERDRYPPRGLAKFAQAMDVAYDTGTVTIYTR